MPAEPEITGATRNTAIPDYHKLREVIFAALDAGTLQLMAGEIKVVESYFSGQR